MVYYFAFFFPEAEDPEMFNVVFPDLPGCVTFGRGMEEAFANATDALCTWLEVEMESGKDLPVASDYATAKVKGEAHVRDLEIDVPEGSLVQLVPADPQLDKPVRVTISLLPKVVELIDRKAKGEGMTRSGFIAHAAKAYNQV